MEKTPEELKKESDAAAAALAGKSLEEEMSLEAPKAGDETIETLRARAEKAELERENYKKAFLKAKKGEVVPNDDEEEEEEDEGKPTLDVKEIAVQAATQVIEKNNEKLAIKQFIDKYPALNDPTVWGKVVENYNAKAGKGTVYSISQDLEAALILARHYGGGKVADKEISLSQFATVSVAGSHASREVVSDLADSTIEMGRHFKNTEEQLRAASEPGANEIKIA